MSEIKLLPCPFCGGDNVDFWETDSKEHPYQIICFSCCNGTDKCRTEEIAITKWNTRKPMQEIVERLEERTDFLNGCTKYGNKNIEQMRESYSTMMMYEVASLVDDLIDVVKEVGGMNETI